MPSHQAGWIATQVNQLVCEGRNRLAWATQYEINEGSFRSRT